MATTSDVRQNPERPPEQWVTRDEPLTGPQESWSGPNIATLAIDGTGAVVAYRKMWPGAAEAKRFAPGPEPAVLDVNVGGWGSLSAKTPTYGSTRRTPRPWGSTSTSPAQ